MAGTDLRKNLRNSNIGYNVICRFYMKSAKKFSKITKKNSRNFYVAATTKIYVTFPLKITKYVRLLKMFQKNGMLKTLHVTAIWVRDKILVRFL